MTSNFTAYIIPSIMLFLLVYGYIKKVSIYECFTDGAKLSTRLIWDIFPYICAIFVAVSLFRASGLAAVLSKFLSPAFSFFGIPPELAELVLIRPLSGNGSLAVLENIFNTYGADSYIARCACIIVGCSETVFYITAVYFSTTGIKKLRYAVAVSLFATFLGGIVGCLLCRVM